MVNVTNIYQFLYGKLDFLFYGNSLLMSLYIIGLGHISDIQALLGKVKHSLAGPSQQDAAEGLQHLLCVMLKGVPVSIILKVIEY